MNQESTGYPNIRQSVGLFLYLVLFGIPLAIFVKTEPNYVAAHSNVVNAITYCLPLLAVIALAVRKMKMSNTPFPGLKFKQVKIDIVCMGVLIALGIGIFISYLQILIPLPEPPPGNNLLNIFLPVIAAPLLEETFFRGIILTGLLQKYKPATAIAFSSLFFGIVHIFPWAIFAASLGGILLGWIYYKTHSLISCMFIHGIYNCFGVLSDHYPDFNSIYKMPYSIITILFTTIIVGLTFRYLNKRLNRD